MNRMAPESDQIGALAPAVRNVLRVAVLTAGAALLAAGLTAAADPPTQVEPAAPVSLFDGKTLDGWRVAAKLADRGKTFWTVRDGAITCDSRGQKDHDYVWLVSDGEYADFELSLKVRGYRDSPGNSGVQVRSRWDEVAQLLDGPQVDINPPAPFRTGLLYDETRETHRWIHPSLPDWRIDPAQGPAHWVWKYSGEGDGWNLLDIACRGTRIRTTLNGVQMADFNGAGILDDAAHRSHNVGLKGHIALQLHTHDDLYIQFKDLLLRVLP